MKYLNNFDNFLNEGLTRTVPHAKAIEILKRNIPEARIENFSYDQKPRLISIEFEEPIDAHKYASLINNLGYFIADKGWETKLMKKITIEGKYYEEPVTNIPKIMYHTTATPNVPKIMRQGLSPKTRSKREYHPERVYLTPQLKFAEWFKNAFKSFGKHQEFTILKIDTTGLDLKVYVDPQSIWEGYYTLDNIPPSHITVL